MDPPARKNHNYIVKVLVPQKVYATSSDLESYLNLMSSETTTTTMMKKNKETGKGRQLKLSDIPYDLMESLLERLSSADRIRFGATCKENLSFVTTAQQHHPYQYQFRTIDKLPWMASFLTGSVHREIVFRLYEPRQRGQPHYADYLIRDPEGEESLGCLIHTKIKACKKGWFLFLFSKQKGMTSFLLFCPFNKRIIKLPDLYHNVVGRKNNFLKDLSMCQATFSSDDPSSSDCVFFFLYPYSTPWKHKISTLDQKNGKWKTKLFDKVIDDVSSIVYHEGCFYCRSFEYELAAYDIIHQTWNLITAPSFPLFIDECGLVACEGKLLLAFVGLDLKVFRCSLLEAFVGLASFEYNDLEAFHCSLFEFNSSTSSWVERTSLGDHALFLGHPNSFTVPVPSGSSVADRMYFYSSTMKTSVPIYYSFRDGRCHMSENGDYWSGVESGMWIEPLPTS